MQGAASTGLESGLAPGFLLILTTYHFSAVRGAERTKYGLSAASSERASGTEWHHIVVGLDESITANNKHMHTYGEDKRLVARGDVEELHDMAHEGRDLASHQVYPATGRSRRHQLK
ncbi:hypothetical protein DFH08DRAFT_945552 [Mycena albidolilacea]|uniref:Uncharacterized protein n=1 Tax=Mycena albidolilacea TaxID=1033008 RepID=A0AAD6Z0I9_9AGAR|nr:hypothetical protein DFH08DRAFT_945552 [Mycena albidolilacea]